MANYIGNQIQRGEFKKLDSIESSFDGSTTTFNLVFNGTDVQVGDTTALVVSLNGVIQEPNEAYTLGNGGSQIVFSSAPAAGNTCFITQLGGIGDTATPSDSSVTSSKIADDAVTSDHLHTSVTNLIDAKAPLNNPSFTGEYVGIPTITTTQRDALTPQNGYLIYNTTINLMQQYADGQWQSIAAPPILTALSYPGSQTAVNPDGGDIITLSGANFEVGANVKFGTTYATSVTRNSSTSLTVTTPAVSAGTYDVVVENPSGLSASLTSGITFNANPVFTTAAGNVGTVTQDVAMSTITIVATEDDSGTLSYSITTGALPTGLSFGSANGEITGTPSGYTGDTTVNFTVTATDDENQTTERQFNLIVLVKFYTYELNQALRINNNTSEDYLTWTPSSAGNRKTWTWSGWIKRGNLTSNNRILSVYNTSDQTFIRFNNTDNLDIYFSSGGTVYRLVTNAFYRDVSAWYHIQVALDTTQATSSDRLKVYVNGERIVSFSTADYPAQDYQGRVNNTEEHQLSGDESASNGEYIDGYLAEVHFIDGQALDATAFGKFTQDIWIPQEYTGTYGTNGFYLDFSDTGTPTYVYNQVSTLTDSSGNYSPTFSNVSISTNQAKYGSYSGLVANNGLADYIRIPQSSNVTPSGSNNITYETWIYYLGDGGYLAYAYQSDWFNPGWFIDGSGQITWGNQSNGGGSLYYFPANTTIPANQWSHIAVTISNKTVTHWINGNNAGSYTYSTGTWSPSASDVNFLQGVNCYFTGFRVSNTIRYSSNFTPNSTGFTTDSNTMLLIQPGATSGGVASVTDTDGTLGDDKSGNGNNWAPYPGLTASDKVIDVPTNNFATMSPLFYDSGKGYPTFSEGNLKITSSSTFATLSSMGVPVGSKMYFEFLMNTTQYTFYITDGLGVNIPGTTTVYRDTSTVAPAGFSTYSNSIVGVAIDNINGTVNFYKDGVSTGDSFTFTGDLVDVFIKPRNPWGGYAEEFIFNFGQDSSFAGNRTSQGNTDGNGIGDFYYTPPNGYLALCTENLSDTGFGDILNVKPSDHFQTVTYSGTGSTQSITGLDFQPDLIWFKSRNYSDSHCLFDSVRGRAHALNSNNTNAESTAPDSTRDLVSFDSNGFTVGTPYFNGVNGSGRNIVAWCWKAGGTPVSNTDGDVTSNVSANQAAGFSIVTWTNSTGNLQVGHGLSQAPELFIQKDRDTASTPWFVVTTAIDGTVDYLWLEKTDAKANWGENLAPTATTFYANGYAGENVAYCFHSVPGFSKISTYIGNGSTDGPFIYTGFKPAFVLVKRTSAVRNWQIMDNVRNPHNPVDAHIHPNLDNTEATASPAWYDSLSNGFKIRAAWDEMNTSGETYLYMAFAEDPFKYSNAR